MPTQASACFFDCPDACGMLVETDAAGGFVRLRGNPEHSWSQGVLCTKTSQYGDVVNSEDRLLHPWMRDRAGRMQPATWDDALDAIAERLGSLPPERILSLDYAGNMGVLGRRFPKRILNALGATLNDGGICDAAAEAGFHAVLGRAIGFDLEDIENSDAIVLWGCDVARTMSHLLPRLARAARRGAWIGVVDLYETDTVEWVRRHGGTALLLRPATDAALALGLCQLAFDSRRADLEFLKRECTGAAEFRHHLAGRYGLEDVCEVTGLEAREVQAFAERWHGASEPVLKLGIGIARRRVGAMNMRALASYAAVLGIVDRVHWESGDHFGLDLADFQGESLRPKGLDQPPVSLVQLGRELQTGRFGASIVWGHNPAVTVPNSALVRRGLADPGNFVVVHELFWTATAKLADVVLPATTFLDQADLLRSYGHRVLHYVPKVLEPRGETRGNVDTFAALGKLMGLDPAVWEGTPEVWVERVLEHNRDRFNEQEWRTLLAHEPVKLAPRNHSDYGTPTGRIELFSSALEAQGVAPIADYTPDPGVGGDGNFWLWPGPSKATHNSTFLHSKRHLARLGGPVVLMHPRDAARQGLASGDWARLSNAVGSLHVQVECSERVPEGALSASGFFHEELVPEKTNINVLVADDLSDLGAGSSLYSTRVNIGKADPAVLAAFFANQGE